MARPEKTVQLADGNAPIKASIHFMKRNDLYRDEKPYAFRYHANASIAQSNITMEQHDDILIHNIRDRQAAFTLDKNGFTILKLPRHIPYEDYSDPAKVKTYLSALEELLKVHFGASRVEVFRYGLRKRHPEFPVSTGHSYEYDQPTSVAHVDTTAPESLEEVKRQHGGRAGPLLSKRVQWINVWKPLRGPLYDWPLTFCDASSVNPGTDLEHADLLYPDFVTENCQVYFNPNHEWYYLSGQNVNEVIVFKQSDTQTGTCPGIPHCSFFNPHTPLGEPPRESIEARALVYYD